MQMHDHAFKEDAGLMMQLTKCKLLVQGAASLLEARTMVRECIDSDPALHSLLEIFSTDEGKEVTRIEGIKCVGVPIGNEDFVHKFVTEKATEIMANVEKVKVVSDPLIHFHLLRFCQNIRLSNVSRNVPPSVMFNASCNVQHVDHAIVKSILQRGTQQKSGNTSLTDKWGPPVLEWHSAILQTTCHLGGFGITPNEASGIAAYYSATAQCRSWLSQLFLPATWANWQDLAHPQTWRSPNLIALNITHARLLRDFQCVERNLQDASADALLADNALPTATTLSIPPLNLLASMRDSSDEENAKSLLPKQRRITAQIMRNSEKLRQGVGAGARARAAAVSGASAGREVGTGSSTGAGTGLGAGDEPQVGTGAGAGAGALLGAGAGGGGEGTAAVSTAGIPIPCTRSEMLRKLHHSQRILAKDPNSILSNDMPDNEDKQADPAKRRHLSWSPPAWLSCLFSI